MNELTSIPSFMLRNASERADRPAIREKDLGIWQTYTWSQYYDQVVDFAMGLESLGFEKNEKLAIIGNNRPKLYWAQMAAIMLGGQSVPVYQDSIASELAYVLDHSESKIMVAEDQEQVDKILSIRHELPNLILLIYDDGRGLESYDNDLVKSFDEIQKMGVEYCRDKDKDKIVKESIDTIHPDDLAFVYYTSGTTGAPKGVMLSHANMISIAGMFAKHEDVRENDNFLSYLPMAWVGDGIYGMALSQMVGCATNCPESQETFFADIRELGPTGIVAPPRLWETWLSGTMVRAADNTPLKRKVFNFFWENARKIEDLKFEGKTVPTFLKIASMFGEYVVYAPFRDRIGLGRARWCLTGGAPLGGDTFRFFRGFGINLKQVYGATETGGLVSFHLDGDVSADSVGPPVPGIDIKLGENNELLVKSTGIFKGYFKEHEKTKDAFVDGEWFKTGDAALLDQKNHIVIVDRAKDVGKLQDGTAFAPQFIENKLKFSPYINEVVAYGDAYPNVTAMVAIDFETVGNWADKDNLPYTNYMDLSQKAEVKDLIMEELRRINLSLPEVLRVKRFVLLTKDLDADDNEITRTRKLRRGFIAEKYSMVIEALYSEAEEVKMKTSVTFEDGTKSSVDSHMKIHNAA